MATKTLTSTTNLNQSGASRSGTGVYTITYPKSSINITGATFNIDDLLPTGVTTKMTWSSEYAYNGESGIGFYFPQKTGTGNAYVRFAFSYGRWANGATKTLSKTAGTSATFNTEDYFNSSNPTSRTYSITYEIVPLFFFNGKNIWTDVEDASAINKCYNVGWATVSLSQTLVLDVPPTATVSALSFDTPYIYAGLTTASVTVSDTAAYYDGTISDVTLVIGAQSDSLSGDGTLSIALDAAGTFTPTVIVTDSRGQTYTEQLAPITVMTYTAPTVTFTAERTTSAGVPDDEGTYATCPSTFVFADAIATAIAPSVVLTDENGTQTTPTVTWYSSRAADGTLSGSVTWSSLSSGDTVYGLIPGLNPNYSYQISIRPRDSEGTGTAIVQTVSSAFYTVDFLAGGHGIAFGQPASQTGFYCNMDTHILGSAEFGDDVYIDLPDYQTTGTTDKAIYDALVALGWDSDVIV